MFKSLLFRFRRSGDFSFEFETPLEGTSLFEIARNREHQEKYQLPQEALFKKQFPHSAFPIKLIENTIADLRHHLKQSSLTRFAYRCKSNGLDVDLEQLKRIFCFYGYRNSKKKNAIPFFWLKNSDPELEEWLRSQPDYLEHLQFRKELQETWEKGKSETWDDDEEKPFFVSLVWGVYIATFENKLGDLKYKYQNGIPITLEPPQALVAEQPKDSEEEEDEAPSPEKEKSIQTIAWLYSIGVTDALADTCREGPHNIVNCYKVADLLQDIAGLKSVTVRKNIEAIYSPSTKNKKNHPFNNSKNLTFVNGKRADFGLDPQKGEK